MGNFNLWDSEFRRQNMFAFNHNASALLWLKVRAVCRSRQLRGFLEESGISLVSTKLAESNVELFEVLEKRTDAHRLLDRFLKRRDNEWYASLAIDEARLKEDLYKVRQYAWGGDQNNSLDKYLVSRYVKVISDYDELAGKQTEIAGNAWNYVQTSWYNNWTSYLIESLFKRHEKVVSAVGEIKSVDFFIDDNPIDLKVTYFPSQYMDGKLRAKLGRGELSWLKMQAKSFGVAADSALSESQQIYTLTEKLSEIGGKHILEELNERRREVVDGAQSDALELMRWLYTNQGEMRFGSENRLYVILVDSSDMSQSWKMKRAFSLIEPKVKAYLDGFTATSLKEIDFTFKGTQYRSLADTLFVVK